MLLFKLPHKNKFTQGVSVLIMCNNNSINSDEKSSVLIDKTKSGKIRPWREKKMANVDYFELLHILEFGSVAKLEKYS